MGVNPPTEQSLLYFLNREYFPVTEDELVAFFGHPDKISALLRKLTAYDRVDKLYHKTRKIVVYVPHSRRYNAWVNNVQSLLD